MAKEEIPKEPPGPQDLAVTTAVPKGAEVLDVGNYVREDRYRVYTPRPDGGMDYRYQDCCGEPEIVSCIHQFMERLPTLEGMPFVFIKKDGKTLVFDGPQRSFTRLYEMCSETLFTPGLHYSPQVEAFAKVMGQFRIKDLLVHGIGGHIVDRSGRLAAEVYNQAFEALKEEVQSPDYRRKVSASVRRCEEAYNSGVGYVDALFKVHSRLLVGRIDLGFEKRLVMSIDLKQVDSFFKAFKNRLRATALGQMLVGSIWCLECTRDRGFHYHMLVFFDGSKHQNHKHLVQQIGEQWVSSVERDLQTMKGFRPEPRTDLDSLATTPGKATFHNCNLSEYQKPFLGQINHDDVLLRERLRENVAYICKADQLLGVKLSRGMRTMGRGELPRIKATRPGRPRKQLQPASSLEPNKA